MAAPSLYHILPMIALELRLLEVSREIVGVDGVEKDLNKKKFYYNILKIQKN